MQAHHTFHTHGSTWKQKSVRWLGVLSSSLVLFAVFLSLFQIFTIKNIVVEGASELVGSDYIDGSVIFLTNENSLKKYLFKKNPTYATLKIDKQYPNTLKITVTEAPYFAALKVNGGYFLLNENGRLIKKTKNLDGLDLVIPLSFYQTIDYGSYATGETLGFQEIADSLFFLHGLKTQGISIDSVAIDNFYMIVLNSTDGKYVFTSEKDKVAQIEQMKEVLRQLHINGKSYISIDVRFHKPVVLLKKDL